MHSNRHARIILIAATLAVLLAGCATPRQTLDLRHAPPEVAPQTELDAVPFYPQQRLQCGPAALATLLVNQGVEVTPEQLEPEVYLPQRRGSLQIELTAAARQRGRLVYPLDSPQLSNLITEVAAGRPVLVMQNLGLSWLPQWHYAVVVGYDLGQGTVTLRSATTRRWISSLAVFERTWARARYWGVLIVPPDEIPQTATPLGYLRAAHDLESVGMLTEASRAYRSAVARWPGEYAAALALGNLEYRRGDFRFAQAVFHEALLNHPEQPKLWNNLAYVLAAQHCDDEAVTAVQCAHRLAPHDENIIASEREITLQGIAGAPRGAGCKPIASCPIH